MTTKYGIWTTTETWASRTGGDNINGSLEEMTLQAKEWNEKQALDNNPDEFVVKYEVKEYTAPCYCTSENNMIQCELMNDHAGSHMGRGLISEFYWV